MSIQGSMNHVRLCVADLDRSAPFYSTVLRYMGFQLMEEAPALQGWAKQGPGHNLQWIIVSQSEAGFENYAYKRGAPGLQHIALNAPTRSDVEAFADHLRAAGIEPMLPPQEFDYECGYFATFVTDPDGIVFEYVHTPVNRLENYRPEDTGAW